VGVAVGVGDGENVEGELGSEFGCGGVGGEVVRDVGGGSGTDPFSVV
jgi:hypothetical protein